MSKTNIRRAEPRDIPKLLELELSGFLAAWSFETIKQEVNNQDRSHYLVADIEEEIVAYAGLWVIFDEGHITRIVVDPKCRRQGIGRKLTKALMEIGAKNACKSFTLEVRSSNIQARKLYEGLGFEEVGLRRGYYESEGEDAVIMWHHPPDYIREGALNEKG